MSQVMKPADIARLRQVGNPRGSTDGDAGEFAVGDPGPRRYTGQGSQVLPRWSPDGHRLAFAAVGGDGRSQICVLPVTGGGEPLGVWSGGRAGTRAEGSPG